MLLEERDQLIQTADVLTDSSEVLRFWWNDAWELISGLRIILLSEATASFTFTGNTTTRSIHYFYWRTDCPSWGWRAVGCVLSYHNRVVTAGVHGATSIAGLLRGASILHPSLLFFIPLDQLPVNRWWRETQKQTHNRPPDRPVIGIRVPIMQQPRVELCRCEWELFCPSLHSLGWWCPC